MINVYILFVIITIIMFNTFNYQLIKLLQMNNYYCIKSVRMWSFFQVTIFLENIPNPLSENAEYATATSHVITTDARLSR